ncbi:uncharacterized protein LOC125312912 [Rhodamnia argentea]|uniref:Uncharacterized protein LOC125312912 n=1 Tax=Rhodamnia argentea TaxID=178133 RepID=A0ABM3GX59_9MYRT|nr:uncharacterized protein LOC125312912 [Rhodamnia argentea]
MFNSEQEGFYAPSTMLGPRISFSHDFADTQQQQPIRQEARSYKEAPVSADFEFSVNNDSMIPADEIFSKGKLLPLKSNGTNPLRKMTLRDELLVDDDDLPRLTSSPGRWRERWGLKRSHFASKKGDRSESSLEKVVEDKASIFALTSKK